MRARLLTAFVLLAAFSTAATAVLTYRQARSSILVRSQSALTSDFRNQVDTLAPALSWPANEADLARFMDQLVPRSRQASVGVVQSVGHTAGDASASGVPVPDELRSRVRGQGGYAYQRVVDRGVPWLVVGASLKVKQPAGAKASAPVEVYLTASLRTEQEDTAAVLDAARNGALPVALAAILLALLSARRVLRPVRDLGRAARELAEGRLGTRVTVKGRDELADLADTFNRSAQELESTVEELRDLEAKARRFAADVSHELRTPLSVMTAVTDVLEEEAPSMRGDAATAAGLVGSETRRLVRLVADLMEISRFDAGAAQLQRQELDVARQIKATVQSRGWQDQARTCLPEGVRARLDPRRLDVITSNLVGNALRHGSEPVTVTLRCEVEDVVIEVADSGPGIPRDALPHLFDRFYKPDAARSRSEGSGLGLAIARENALLHGGELTAANRPGGGAVFTVRLPSRGSDQGDAGAGS
ncbi:HAMP domain-containing sensor histidine kinase [Streptomyces lavendulae]|uniref:sensor histidine kinase n=1 Tax=Streptomyces lavendulae TaxID=1914 RepID=UPI0031EAFAB6